MRHRRACGTGYPRDACAILGIPAAVLSPAIATIARRHGRDVTGNFIDREMPFVPSDATLVTISGGANDANAVGNAMAQGAAGADVAGYIDAQARAFGADFDRLARGVRSRAPGAFLIILNVPNLAAMPYAARYSLDERRGLQAIATAFSREANRQAGNGIAVLDLMCDPVMYNAGSFSSDGYHPNDAGYAHIATRLAAIVNGASAQAAISCGPMTAVPVRCLVARPSRKGTGHAVVAAGGIAVERQSQAVHQLIRSTRGRHREPPRRRDRARRTPALRR